MPKFAHSLVSSIVALIGLAICAYSVYNSIDIVDMLVHGEKAEALVIKSVREVKGGGGGGRHRSGTYAIYNITVSYTDAQGVVHTAEPPVNDTSKRLKGDRVPIYYLPDAPDKVMVDIWTSKTAPVVIPLLVGLAFLAGGLFMLKESRQKDEEDDGEEEESEDAEAEEPEEESRKERFFRIVNHTVKWCVMAFFLYWIATYIFK